MDRTPPPISLAAALALLPKTTGRRATDIFEDGELQIRFSAPPTNGPQVPHERDEFYIVTSGTGRYRVEDRVTDVAAGDLLFAAAHAPHGFEDFSADFAIWVGFYGPKK
jgi:mannose-6-phosphate isomerase-like protein (cupin superfamily)